MKHARRLSALISHIHQTILNWFSKRGLEESGEVGSGGGSGQGDAKELGSPVLTQVEDGRPAFSTPENAYANKYSVEWFENEIRKAEGKKAKPRPAN